MLTGSRSLTRMRRFFRRYWLAFAIIILFIAMWAGLWANRYSRIGLTTIFLMPDLFADSPASLFKVVGDEPLRQEVTIIGPDGPFLADVYRPADGDEHGAMLIAVGAAPRIRSHPGVIRLSKTAARAGIVVMIPQLYYPFRERTLPQDVKALVGTFQTDIRQIAASYQWLKTQPYVDSDRAGIFGASVGAGLALVAASDPGVRDDIDFFVSLGTYYDMVDLFNAITTETIHYNGRNEPWDPWLESVHILYRSLIQYLPDQRDRQTLTDIFLGGSSPGEVQVASLSAQGRQVYDALIAGDPQRILDVWSAISPGDVAVLRQISPSTTVSAYPNTELFIIHDRSDPYIPYVESRRLRDAVAANGSPLHYAEFDIFDHVEPTNWTDPLTFIANIGKLLFYVWLLLLRLI